MTGIAWAEEAPPAFPLGAAATNKPAAPAVTVATPAVTTALAVPSAPATATTEATAAPAAPAASVAAAPAAAAVAPVIAAAPAINAGDTAWLLASAALVMLMTPGLAFFYGGLVRRKNVLSVLMQCMIILCLVTLQWVIIGYSLSFGPDIKGFIGDLSWIGLKGVGLEPHAVYGTTVPHQAFMIFQAMFAVITPALIIGAFAERIRFVPFCIFTLLWTTIVYDPVCHWVWADKGLLGTFGGMGALDFAGGTVVHINAGMAALAAALFLGKRMGYPDKMSPPHNLPFAVLGAGLLWFGWFGFNAGSALAANGLAASAFVVTHVATAAAGLAWAIMDLVFNKRSTVLGVITGAVAGLVAITPASGFVTPMGAIVIGLGSGVICYISVSFCKAKFGYDDSLDAFGVHGIGGIWGAIATGLFATTAINSAGANGLFYGNPGQLMIQLKAVAITMVYAFVVSYALFWIVDKLFGLRTGEHEERVGLDLTEHREAAYTTLE
ncbi:MAG TPA: ammonia channel protein [Lentisphaeria bacterium]|nr:ammonia channel protein [Lentisphaeria bacterium]